MHENYWQLNESAFCSPRAGQWNDPSPQHTEALARLLYVIEGRRCLGVLTGPAGTGKSSLLRALEHRLQRTRRTMVFVDLRNLDADELLDRLSVSFHLSPDARMSASRFWQALRYELAGLRLARSQGVALFDHGGGTTGATAAVLARLLSLAEDNRYPLSLIAAARSRRSLAPELAEAAALRIELSALDAEQTADYVRRQCKQAGGVPDFFSRQALAALFEQSGGILREINRLAELALMAAMSDGCDQVDADVVIQVSHELDGGIHFPTDHPAAFANV